jgi:predicted aspartyl protease
MEDLFWGWDCEDVSDWAEQLTMAAEVRDLTPDKLFKITKLNLRGRAKEWFRRLQPAPADWDNLRMLMIQKYGNVDTDDVCMKLDAIEQEPRERVQKYFERLDKLFRKGTIPDVEHKRRFLARLRPEIRKLCMVRTFVDIEELVGAATEVEKVLGELGETPYELLREEQEEEMSESNVEKQVTTLNNTLINFFKRNSHDPASSSSSTVFGGCQLCKGGDHMATACPRLNEARPKCAKSNMPHRIENYGIKCAFCVGLGHSEDKCWKKPKDGKSTTGAANFLEVLLDDETAIEQQLNKLCGNENLFSYTRVPRRRTLVDAAQGGVAPAPEAEREGASTNRDASIRSKILSHFVKEKISLSPMETILMIPGELEHLENLVKLVRKKRDLEATENQVSVVSAIPSLKRICVSKTHRSKTLHLPVEINKCIVEGLVDTGASMFVLVVAVVRELGMMHLVTGNESYKTASRVVTRALGQIDELQVRIGGIQCTMTFMVVDTDGYDVLLGLDFLMKIGAVLDVERGLIQVRHGPGTDVEVLPLTMVNLLKKMSMGAMQQKPSTTQKDAPAVQDDDAALDQVLESIQEGDGVSFSDSDDDDNSEYHDSESNQFEQVNLKDEFADVEFEELVSSEGP